MAEDKKEGEGSVEQTELEKKSKKELIEIIEKLIDKKKDLKRLGDDQLKQQKEMNELLRANANYLGDLTERNKLNVEILKQQADMEMRSLIEKGQLDDEQRSNILKGLDEIEEYGTSQLLANANISEELEGIIEKLKEESKIKRGSALIDKAGITIHKDIAKTLGIKVKVQDTFLGQLGMIGTLLSENKDKQGEILAGLKNQIKGAFHYRKIAASVFSAIYENSKELFMSFDKAQASLAAATGQGDKFRGTLYEVGREGNLFGVSMDDAGKAIGTLVDQTSNFTSLSKTTQASVALNVAKMEKLGVATSDSAAIFQNFNQALGMTAKESMNMQTELAMAGVSIGVNAGKMTKDFNASLSTLMVYGRESVDVFKGIAAAAKAAGVETSTLLGIASKFDTFAGAAEGAGKLNALLGTQLSTTEMLMATEDERIRMLVESVQSQGVAFQDMDRFTQKAIANSVGITDMAEANRIFGMSLSAYDENERKLNASANAQKKLDDAVAKTVPVMDQFKKLGAELVVALEPLLETLESGAKSLTDFFKSMSTEDKEMLASVVSIFSGLVLIWPVLKLAFAGFSLFGSAILPAVGLGSKAAATGMAAAGSAATGATAPVAAFAGALGAVAIEVVLIVGVIALLAAAMAGMYYGMAAIAEAIGGIFSTIFTGITNVVSAIRGTNEETAQFEARAAEAMATIVSGNHEGALSSIKAMVEEVNKMGQDIKVSSTIENLALITAGKASSITGERVTASQTNVTANVQNFFEGMEMTLNVDGANFKAYVAKVANGEST
jgi:hypothetical protein